MTAKEVLAELKLKGNESTKKILEKHGAPSNQYGVKVEELKKIQKRIKKNYELSLELFDSGISDAQYLAGLIADETKMTKKDLQHWADKANWSMLSEYTVAWIAAESDHGWELAVKWIDSDKENVQSSGWATLGCLVAIKPDDELDIAGLKKLVKRVEKKIHSAKDQVKNAMNNFMIAAGSHVKDLTALCMETAKKLGTIAINKGDTACKVPYAPDYIRKAIDRGLKKKKMARC